MRLVIFKMSTTLKLLFLSTLTLSVKSNQCQNSRIIFDGPTNDPINCIKDEFCNLKCTCSKSVNLEFFKTSSTPTKEFQYLKENIQTHPRPQKLFFESCSFSIIGREVFKRMDIQQPITEISFKNGNLSRIDSNSFVFDQTEKVKLSFEKTEIRNLKHLAFGDNVNHVLIQDSIVKDFSTDMFDGMNKEGLVEIADSELNVESSTKNRDMVTIQRMNFTNLRFKGHIVQTFLNVDLNTITFQKCIGIELNAPNAINILAKKVIFQDSELKLNSKDAIRATADEIIFENCKFDEPQKKSLMGLTKVNDASQLVMKNLFITDPAKGFFQTNFKKVSLDNITLDSCSRGCSLFEDLSCDANDFRGFESGLTCDDTKELLKSHTSCRDGKTSKMAKDLCIPSMDNAAMGVMIATSLVLVIVLVICAILFYKWYTHDRIRRKQLKKWRFAYPQITQYK